MKVANYYFRTVFNSKCFSYVLCAKLFKELSIRCACCFTNIWLECTEKVLANVILLEEMVQVLTLTRFIL